MRILPVVLLAACATAPRPTAKGGPRGLRADEHLDLAAQHDELARRPTWPDTRGAGPGMAIIPWTRSWDPDHTRLAAIHRSKAAELHAEFDDACGTRADGATASPIARYGLGGWNTSTGAIVHLAGEAGPASHVMADLACHRAWMMLSSESGMDDCPLDLPGIRVDAHGDEGGITLSIVVPDALVDELHRRIAIELGHHEH